MMQRHCLLKAIMEKTVFVIDDDRAVRQSVSRLLRSAGHVSKEFESSESFLCEPLLPSPACMILDMYLASSSGFDVIDALEQRGIRMPVIFVTGHGSIPLTVRAMKAGASEFLTKPIDSETLLRAVDDALLLAQNNYQMQCDFLASKQRYDTLTQREREVLSLAIGGLLNKQIAHRLGIQEVTAKVHKQKVMEKMGTKSLAELVRMTALINGVGARYSYEAPINLSR